MCPSRSASPNSSVRSRIAGTPTALTPWAIQHICSTDKPPPGRTRHRIGRQIVIMQARSSTDSLTKSLTAMAKAPINSSSGTSGRSIWTCWNSRGWQLFPHERAFHHIELRPGQQAHRPRPICLTIANLPVQTAALVVGAPTGMRSWPKPSLLRGPAPLAENHVLIVRISDKPSHLSIR